MRRRRNKSNKVPNVKLRPAEKGSYSTPVTESCWAQDTQPGSEDSTLYDLCPRPFKGFVICATGVQDKPTLFKQAVELGATCTPAFTDRVTHLIAVDHGGAKYTCALERKIPIVKPSWIIESYQIWLRGDDVDIVKSVEQHRLPIFSGAVVCPSGITDITRRTQISKLITAHDGFYVKNLERPVRVTHLLCSGDEDTDKMRYAEKFNSRGEANIHLVWEEWFWDSLDFGGRFDESSYQVRGKKRPSRKCLPNLTTPFPQTLSDIPSQLNEHTSPSATHMSPSRRHTLNDEGDKHEDEPAFVNVLPAVTVQLWGGLLQRRGYQITDGEVILSPSTMANTKHLNDYPRKSPVDQQFGAAMSVIHSVRNANSFAPAISIKDPGSSRYLPFRMASPPAVLKTFDPSTTPSRRNLSAHDAIQQPVKPHLFSGLKFCALGEAKTAVVRTVIEQLRGKMVANEDDGIDYILVRLVSGSKIYREEEDQSRKVKYRTECWLERCIYEDRICNPQEHVTYVPLSIELPLFGAEKILMSISGFDQSESCGLKRLVRALGISLVPTFSRHSTHLLCPSGKGLKFEKALEWDVPIINLQWLNEMAATGSIPHVQNFLVSARADDAVLNLDHEPRREVVKGKQRAILDDVENQDVDPHSYTPKRQSAIPTLEPAAVDLPHQIFVCNASSSAIRLSNCSQNSGSNQPSSNIPAVLGNINNSQNVKLGTEGGELAIPKVYEFRIPSSTSPSPMKSPDALGGVDNRQSSSPVKIDREATKALQESIASLLGKRPSPDEQIIGVREKVEGRGKRARPQRKLQSRQASDMEGYIVPNRPDLTANNPLLEHLNSNIQESLRVMYEDPGQQEEKKRLIGLLKKEI